MLLLMRAAGPYQHAGQECVPTLHADKFDYGMAAIMFE
jgi:hypothetical protein